MSRATLIPMISMLKLESIEVTDDRLRPVSDAAVAAIATSIEEHGLIYPLVVRRTKGPRYELVDGGHRRAALERLGVEMVPVRCYEGPAPAIRLIEIDTNLARADLSDLDRAIHMAARRREYVEEHPETAQGAAGAAGRWNASAEMALASFVGMTIEQTGLSKRKILKLAQAGDAIDTVMAERLRSAPQRVFLNDLLALAKAQPAAREAAVEAFASGSARKIAAALKPAREAPMTDPVEDAFKALSAAWERAPKAARKRFVDKIGVEVLEMLGFGRSFADVFDASYEAAPIRKATDAQRRFWLMGAEGLRADSKTGVVRFQGNEYWAEWMSGVAGDRVIARFDPAALWDGLHIYSADNAYLGHAPCKLKSGFFDVTEARSHAKARRAWMNAEKAALAAHRKLSATELGTLLDRVEKAEPVAIEAKVVRPVFGRPTSTVPDAAPRPDVEALQAEIVADLSSRRRHTQADETARDRFRRALELERSIEGGAEITPDQARWLDSYRHTPEYAAERMLWEDFGDAVFQ